MLSLGCILGGSPEIRKGNRSGQPGIGTDRTAAFKDLAIIAVVFISYLLISSKISIGKRSLIRSFGCLRYVIFGIRQTLQHPYK